ncbi:MAG: hypothetical protein MRERV_46c023 [Mycoplasmataceae bacterium RV_VA103A]|nr:MAG: hypothetical protein MRERV_46c023 [Mycoplasmataceae bacterium RV_VA103A]
MVVVFILDIVADYQRRTQFADFFAFFRIKID